MISGEIEAKIRRLFFAEHWKVGTIAAELGLHHETVKRALNLDERPPPPRRVPSTILDPYKPFIIRTLEKYPRLRATRILEMVRSRGYRGSYEQLKRYVRETRPERQKEAYLRLRTLPGEQAQVDWGSFGKHEVGRAKRQLSCFVMVLSWSRALYARFFWDQKLESFLWGHVEAFEALGGVSRELLYDNLKSVVLERDGDHVRYHPHILELAGHYHFAPKPCAPYRGNEKGKVERTIQYLRHSFFAARKWRDIDDLNAQLRTWIDQIAHRRPVPGDPERQLVSEALLSERECLLPLPAQSFSCELVKSVTSGKTPYVRFDLNDYSIPHTLIRKPLCLLASPARVRITMPDGTVVAEHARTYDRGQVVEDEAHIAALASEKRHAAKLRVRDRLRIVCPHADAFIDALSRRDTVMSVETRRLAMLLDRYGAAALDAAIADALARGALSANAVAYILDQQARMRGQPPPVDLVLPNDDRIRDLHVVEHELDAYDDLARKGEDDADEQE
jgi:transposase